MVIQAEVSTNNLPFRSVAEIYFINIFGDVVFSSTPCADKL